MMSVERKVDVEEENKRKKKKQGKKMRQKKTPIICTFAQV